MSFLQKSEGCSSPTPKSRSTTGSSGRFFNKEITTYCIKLIRNRHGTSWWNEFVNMERVGGTSLSWNERDLLHRLPPTAVQMNHERLPRHGLYFATSSMTSRSQIWHMLNITSSFLATLFKPNFQLLREKYSDRYWLSMQTSSSQSCDINWLDICTDG
jgi:hypothetical protein